MKFMHIADVHYGRWCRLSRYSAEFSRQRRHEVAKTFERIIDYANQNNVDFILCAGDLLDNESVSQVELRNINDTIEKLENCRFICVTGNHDALHDRSAYYKIKWTRKFELIGKGLHKISMDKFGTDIYAYSWEKNTYNENPIAIPNLDRARKNILLTHGEVAAKSDYLPLSVRNLAGLGFDYIALGHIHKPCKIGDIAYYSGSPEPLDSSETGAHGFMLCELGADDKKFTFNFTPFSLRTYKEVTVTMTKKDSQVALIGKIKEQTLNSDNIYKVKLTGVYHIGEPPDITRMCELLLEDGLMVDIEDETRPGVDFNLLKEQNEENIIGQYIASFGELENLQPIERESLEIGVEALLSGRVV